MTAVPNVPRPHALFRPIFVIGAPGTDAEAVVDALATAEGVHPLALEGHPLEAAPNLRPANRGLDSARLGRLDARPPAVAAVEDAWQVPSGQRLVATWDDAGLQIPFLAAAWPDATIVFVHRDPLEALTVMQAGWAAPWTGPLVPGWRGLPTERGEELIATLTHQWCSVTDLATAELSSLPAASWLSTSVHAVSTNAAEVARLGHSLGLVWAHEPSPVALAPTPTPLLTPEDLGEHLARIAEAAQRARETLEHAASGAATSAPASPAMSFNSVATPNVAQLLTLLGSSVAATTYQSNRVVFLRATNGDLNTHFRSLPKPMGLAYRPGVMAIGTKSEVVTFADVPGLAEHAGPQHDAVFVPTNRHTTGDIRIHDVGWVGDELWAVNTRFSCLATFDGLHSFVPRWKPSFISDLMPEDRCHLNGMAIVNDQVRFVTALGTTDTPGGWRPHKADGGVIIDVSTQRIVASGLSMPHSPRWHGGQLWFLESGQGTLARVNTETGDVTTVATLPGFTRGLAFAGRYAFVGLSQVREATTFGGLPLTARLEDRQCGIWVVDIETGETMGFVRFEGAVQEIFDVVLLPEVAFPELVEPDSQILDTAYVVPSGL